MTFYDSKSSFLSKVSVWCRHCPTAYCPDHSGGVTIHPELGAVCGAHLEDAEELAFLLQLVRSQGLEDNLPCPSPNQEQLAVWRRARGADPAQETQARPGGVFRRLNRFSVNTPDTPTTSKTLGNCGRRLQTSLDQMDAAEVEEVSEVTLATQDEVMESNENQVEIKYEAFPQNKVETSKTRAKHRSPQKESWDVAKVEFRREEKSTWRCNQPRCRFKGAESAEKMRRHLTFHKLSEAEIERLAGDEDRMGRELERMVRIEYRDLSGLLVAQGPLSMAGSGEMLGEEFTCEAAEECDLAFCTEAELLEHLRQFHPPKVKKELVSSLNKLEVGGLCGEAQCGDLASGQQSYNEVNP